jgi:hypothetical protein
MPCASAPYGNAGREQSQGRIHPRWTRTSPGCASATWVENGTGFLVPTRSMGTRKAPQGKGAPPVRPAARLGAVAQGADLVANRGNEVQGHNPLLCRDLLGLGRLVATLPRTSRLATRARQTRTDSDRATRLPRPIPSPPRKQGGDALPPSHAERGNEKTIQVQSANSSCCASFEILRGPSCPSWTVFVLAVYPPDADHLRA